MTWTDRGEIDSTYLTYHLCAKVMYGPLIHEGQSASVIIGPIVCEGHTHVSLQSIVKNLTQEVRTVEVDLETLETGLVEVQETLQQNNETLEKLEKIHNLKFQCIGEKFKFILGNCYYFNTSPKILSVAKDHCSTIFNGMGRFGKLFEPVDIHTFNAVNETNTLLSVSKTTWIGFVRSDENNWKRISDGLPAPKLWGSIVLNNNYSKYPYMVFHPNQINWDIECECNSDDNPSVCEAI